MKKKEETYVYKKTNPGLIAAMIIVAIIITIGSFILPFVAIISLSKIFDYNVDYVQVDDKTINIDNAKLTLNIASEEYNKEDKCYILDIRTNKKSDKKNKGLFDYDTLNVVFTFKDKEGYVVGNETLYIEDIDDHDKWHQQVEYCGSNAINIKSYEVSSIEAY